MCFRVETRQRLAWGPPSSPASSSLPSGVWWASSSPSWCLGARTRASSRYSIVKIMSSGHKHCLSSGCTDVDSRLLLAVLALLLHESDESSHWTSSRDESLVCDEEGVGWFRWVETDVKKEPAFLSLIYLFTIIVVMYECACCSFYFIVIIAPIMDLMNGQKQNSLSSSIEKVTTNVSNVKNI